VTGAHGNVKVSYRRLIWQRILDAEFFILRRIAVAAYTHHVFVCHNSRPAGAPRQSCTVDGKSDLHTQLKQLTQAAGLDTSIRINKAGCLDQCEHGPVVVVYPEGVWYGNVQPSDAAVIVSEHLTSGHPVERLRLNDECLNSKNCPHRD